MEQGVSFGGYRFDVETGRLWSGTREIRLTPKASAVLKVLVTRAGQPVSKEDLFASVWSDTVVSDDALTSCIQELRRALEDDAKQPRFIETRHRRGYRFVAPALASRRQRRSPSRCRRQPAPDISAIAVLPFADMSPGRDQDYLCEGLAEELINVLTQIDGLRVVARTASFQFRSTGADIREIGRQLARRDAARGQRSQGGRSSARDGTAHRGRERLSPVVAALRSQARRRLCDRGRDRGKRRDLAAREACSAGARSRRCSGRRRVGGLRVLPARPAAPSTA